MEIHMRHGMAIEELGELIENALKHMADGGEVRVITEKKERLSGAAGIAKLFRRYSMKVEEKLG